MNQRPPRLALVANAKVPGHRAHSIQSVRSSAAWAEVGVEAELVVPRRRGIARQVTAEDLVVHYGLRRPIACRWISCLDWIDLFPPGLQRLPFLLEVATFARAAGRYLARDLPDVVYLRDPHTLYFLRRGHPELTSRLAFEAHGVPGSARARRRLRRALVGVTAIVAVNPHLAERYAELGVEDERLAVVPAAAASGGTPPERAAARRELGLAEDTPIVAYAGSLTAGKGVATLLAAAAELPDWTLLIVGGGDAGREERSESRGGARVVATGRVAPSRVASYLAAADVLVAPNSGLDPAAALWTSPMKLFEYHAAGRPIVATDVPALRQAAAELDGEPRIVWAAPDEPIALARAIASARSDGASSPARERTDGWVDRALRIRAHLVHRGLLRAPA